MTTIALSQQAGEVYERFADMTADVLADSEALFHFLSRFLRRRQGRKHSGKFAAILIDWMADEAMDRIPAELREALPELDVKWVASKGRRGFKVQAKRSFPKLEWDVECVFYTNGLRMPPLMSVHFTLDITAAGGIWIGTGKRGARVSLEGIRLKATLYAESPTLPVLPKIKLGKWELQLHRRREGTVNQGRGGGHVDSGS